MGNIVQSLLSMSTCAATAGPHRHAVLQRRQRRVQGRAVQVDPMEPMLKPLGTKHLTLKYDILLSTFAFKIQLAPLHQGLQDGDARRVRGQLAHKRHGAGAYTRPLFSST